jgi:plant 4alpha-monomethylsterol monooxygenase
MWLVCRPVFGTHVFNRHAAEPTVWTYAYSILFALVVEDFVFYWHHRFMHAYAYSLHKRHHEHRLTCALSGAYMHPIEHLIIVTGVIAPMIVLRAHWKVWLVWCAVRNIETSEEHSNYDFPVRAHHYTTANLSCCKRIPSPLPARLALD